MRCYSHLSDDEREQIRSGQGCGPFDWRDCQSDRPAEVDGLRAASRNKLPSGALFARFTPPEPINCAGGVKRGSKRSSLTDLRCRPARGRVDPGANFRLAQGRKRTSPAGRGLRDDLRLHLQGSATGRAVMALPHAPSQTPPPAPIETFARYRSRIASPSTNGPSMSRRRTEGGHLGG